MLISYFQVPGSHPLRFFLWGYAKHLIYDETTNNDLLTIDDLYLKSAEAMEVIRDGMENIPINEQILRRINLCIEQNGGLIEHLL